MCINHLFPTQLFHPSKTVEQWEFSILFPVTHLLPVPQKPVWFWGFFNSLRNWRCVIQNARKQIINPAFAHKSWEKNISTVNKMKSNLLSHCCHISLCGSIIIWCIAGLCCTLCTPCNAEWCQRTSWCHKHQPQI